MLITPFGLLSIRQVFLSETVDESINIAACFKGKNYDDMFFQNEK